MSEAVDLMDVGEIEWWPLERVTPYARNAKTHDEGGVAQLAGMIKEFGWTYPILVDEEGVILAGHKRRLASQRLGLVNVPVLVKKGLDKHQKQAYRIGDNKTTENSPWDVGLLKIEIGELRDAGMDLGLTAWDGEGLKTLYQPADGDWARAVGGLPAEDRSPFQQMTFTLHDTQAEQVKAAMAAAGKLGDFADSPNQNSNGNALAFICEIFITEHGQS